MFGKHVSKQLAAYAHDELSAKSKARVAEHLIICSKCRERFQEIKFATDLAGTLPTMAAPAGIWTEIEAQLDKYPASRRETRHVPAVRLKWALAAGVIVAVAIGFGIWAIRESRKPAWAVARLAGSPRVGSRTIGNDGRLRMGQWLETDGGSRARIDIADIGQAEIDPNSRVRLIESRPTEHRLELARGRMSARVWAPPKLFFVNTPSGVAEDLGCAYTLEVDDDGNSTLHVTIGWVSLQLTDREATVPAGAACATRRGRGPGTPYFEDASEAFRVALSQFDFTDDASAKASVVKSILNEARPHDAMTLWYLLSRVDEKDRPRVYDRLAQLARPPEGVTREGVIGLNQQMLNAWKDSLGFAPGAFSPKLNLKKIRNDPAWLQSSLKG
jgi:FecR protein/Putative zinc-finger